MQKIVTFLRPAAFDLLLGTQYPHKQSIKNSILFPPLSNHLLFDLQTFVETREAENRVSSFVTRITFSG